MPETSDVEAALAWLRTLVVRAKATQRYDIMPPSDSMPARLLFHIEEQDDALVEAKGQASDLLIKVEEQAREIERLTPQALPYTTPTGHTYELPTDWPSLHNYMVTWAQGWVEHWDDAEMPPHPENQPDIARLTWNLLAAGQHEIERLRVELQSLRTLHAMVHSGDDCDEVERLRGLLREAKHWINKQSVPIYSAAYDNREYLIPRIEAALTPEGQGGVLP